MPLKNTHAIRSCQRPRRSVKLIGVHVEPRKFAEFCDKHLAKKTWQNTHLKKSQKQIEFLWSSTFFNQDTVFSFLPLNTETLANLPFAILLTAFFFITLIAFIAFIAVADFMDFMTVFFIGNAIAESE